MIPFSQGVHRVADEQSFVRSIGYALPRTYAVVFYSTDARFGWFLLLLGLLVPKVALAGLGGVIFAMMMAWVFGLDRGFIRSGFLLFNPLLSCSALQLMADASGWSLPLTLALLAAASASSMLLTSALHGWVGARMGISPQSVPSVLVVMLLCHAGWSNGGLSSHSSWSQVDWLMMPSFLRAFFRAFAAMVFQASDLTGILIYVAFVLISPLGGLTATVGYVAGALTLQVLGVTPDVVGSSWCGFNFLLAGVALGAGYHVTNKKSLGMAAIGGALTAVVAVGLSGLLGFVMLGPGALPYNLVVIGVVAALRLAVRPNGLIISPWTTLQPEGVARLMQINRIRFPHYYSTALFLPCAVETVVTQGFDGALTHRGAWCHALDLEAPGGAGSWDAGDGNLHDFAIFGAAVYAPVDGTVVALENHIADNPTGQNNPQSNWGNHVILRTDAGAHVMLAHLMVESVAVEVGQRVMAGTCLGVCGNSGRSPVPHLHLHVQTGPWPGSPTAPFVLKHYVQRELGEQRSIYHLSGIPSESSMIRPAVPSPVLHACISGWLPGYYRYDVGGKEELLQMNFDERGRFRLECVASKECLTLYLSEGVLYADSFEGRISVVLSLMSILLARVPCIDEADVIWHDVVAAAPHLAQRRRWFHNLWDPFMDVAVIPYQYSMVAQAEGAEITALLEATRWKDRSIPQRMVGEIRGRHGLVRAEGVTSGGAQLGFSLVDYSPDWE